MHDIEPLTIKHKTLISKKRNLRKGRKRKPETIKRRPSAASEMIRVIQARPTVYGGCFQQDVSDFLSFIRLEHLCTFSLIYWRLTKDFSTSSAGKL